MSFVFYLGGYPQWLPKSNVPLFISRRFNLNKRTMRSWIMRDPKKLPKAKKFWALDSGGFKELEAHGTWELEPEDYVKEVRIAAEHIGKLQWAAIMDWMCEPSIIDGGPTDSGCVAVGTSLTVAEHQYRTIENYCILRELGGREMRHLWVPVLQGWCQEDYLNHLRMWKNYARIDLRDFQTVGLGSICRRQGKEEIKELISILYKQGLTNLHAFGSKIQGLSMETTESLLPSGDGHNITDDIISMSEEMDVPLEWILFNTDWIGMGMTWEEVSAKVCSLLVSADSQAGSKRARGHAQLVWRARTKAFGDGWKIPEGTGKILNKGGKCVGTIDLDMIGKIHHLAPSQMLLPCAKVYYSDKKGGHIACNKCFEWALKWRKDVLLSTLNPSCRGTRRPDIMEAPAPVCKEAWVIEMKKKLGQNLDSKKLFKGEAQLPPREYFGEGTPKWAQETSKERFRRTGRHDADLALQELVVKGDLSFNTAKGFIDHLVAIGDFIVIHKIINLKGDEVSLFATRLEAASRLVASGAEWEEAIHAVAYLTEKEAREILSITRQQIKAFLDNCRESLYF